MTSVALFAAMVLLPVLAHGQAARVGPTFGLGGTTSPVEQPDVAHDSINNRYLQVAGKGFIEAHLLDAAGGTLAAFRVNATGEYAQSPRVAFSPNVPGGGGYLVTWHSSIGDFTRVRGRIIRVDGAAVTSDFEIATSAGSKASSSNWTMGAAVAYATGSQEFLVAWMGNYGSTNDIFFQRVSNVGALLGPNTLVSAGTADWDRDPSVAYNPNYDEFYVAYAGYFEAGRYGFTAGRRIKAGTGQIVSAIAQFGAAVSTYVPAVTYNTAAQQYLLAWYNRSASGAAVYGVTLDAAGSLIGAIRALSPVYAAYDALDLDYNAPSGQYLLVTHGGGATPWEDAAVSILDNGNAYDNGFIVTNTTDVRALRSNPAANDGNYNPRLAASTSEKKWLLVTSSGFAATHAQFAGSNGSGGPAPPPPPPPPPPPAGSDPRMSLDSPGPNTTVSGQFSVAGWAVDLGATSGTGIVAVHAWAFPASGGGATFLGAATLGGARADVAGYLGRSQFSTSGFNLAGSLPPGTYDVRVSALSAVAGGFNNAATVRITVAAPASIPRMWLDAPAQNQTITQFFTIVGWALDLGAASGSGVDGVHVWAYPVGGGSPVWAGAGSVGHSRPDVAGAFGPSRGGAGFFVTASLPPGEYNLVVYVHSSVTGTFNQTMVLRIRVV